MYSVIRGFFNDLAKPSSPLAAGADADIASMALSTTAVRGEPAFAWNLAQGETGAEHALTYPFVEGHFENTFGRRAYRLYVPNARAGQATSLIVMLHGAGQDDADFAAGTRMHELAGQCGALVLYPVQGADSNFAKCWNWFDVAHQERGQGEASVLAEMTRAVMSDYGISPRRVYVAGLSAGGAMAVILGRAYPDLYAAVGVHSGLPYGVAANAASAFHAMSHGPSDSRRPSGPSIPTIVFHGDADTTVHQRNATAIVEDALGSPATEGEHAGSVVLYPSKDGIRGHTRKSFEDRRGHSLVEQWTIHDGGHAWAGGAPGGSHTDPNGPDATREMLRFFRTHELEPRVAVLRETQAAQASTTG